ncbi:MAG TPA: TonB-dependent receptor, partial [Woeseiaceae bacterium]|nr:TonB-dependent receptor [Woeseiaceae bacterium]
GWRQGFAQTIDAFQDYSYSALKARERGRDETSGARVTLSLGLDRAKLRFVSTTQVSTHDNQELEVDALVAAPILRYKQQLSTLGAEADLRISESLTTTFGIALDRADTPLTGDKPELESLSATGWSSGLRWASSDKWSATATLGQRTRFPTPRELFGAALGRFLVNPDLSPERALLGDVTMNFYPNNRLFFNVAAWANKSDDTLSQRAVMEGGDLKRQRYNTNGSLTYGVDTSATWFVTENFRAELSAALQGGRMERDENGERPVLLQRPGAQGRVALDWQANQRIDLRAEVLHTSAANDWADDGSAARLPAATSLNLRGFFQLDTWAGRNVHLTASIDNLTDELVLPQLGLPAPGRSYRLGLRVN